MAYRRNEIIVGTVVVLAATLFVALLFGMGALTGLFKDAYPLYVYFNDIGYLPNHAQVLQGGVPIGEIVSIRHLKPGETVDLADGRTIRPAIRVELSIYEGAHVDKDSAVYIDTKGMLGDPFLAIAGAPAPPDRALLPGDAIQGQDSVSLLRAMNQFAASFDTLDLGQMDFTDLSRRLTSLIASATGFLDAGSGTLREMDIPALQGELTALFQSGGRFAESASDLVQSATLARILASLDGTGANLNRVSASVADRIDAIRDELEGVLRETGALAASARQLVDDNSGEIGNTVRNLESLSADLGGRIAAFVSSATALLGELDGVVAENRSDLREIVEHLRLTSIHAEEFSALLAEQPWRLIWKTPKEREPLHPVPPWIEEAETPPIPAREVRGRAGARP